MFKQRSTEPEIMDDLSISGEIIGQTLREISSINNLLGGNAISMQVFRRMVRGKKSIRVVDLGCGSGDIMVLMAKFCRKNEIDGHFIGIDANPHIVEYAREHTADFPEIEYEAIDVLDESFNLNGYDIVHCCLFLHHFSNDQLLKLLGKVDFTTARVIINDLHRHFLAFWSIKLLTALFSRSYMVRNDAAVSVKRGFKRQELISLLQNLGVNNYALSWKWAFRWQLSF